METKTKNILVPFVGFYESLASSRAEDMAFRNFISENGIIENETTGWLDVPEDMTEEEQEKFWDYYGDNCKDYEKEVAVAYIDALASELGIDINFESIYSPKQYNYTTDRLFVDVLEKELIDLYNRTDKEILAEVIKENHTSGPGFSSYYDNEITAESWSDPEKYDHNQWETVILANLKQNKVELSELYWI
jgi:hypothetical protein